MMKKRYDIVLVSACLVGVNCRYDGTSKREPYLLKLVEEEDAFFIPICPELFSGLAIPRLPAQIESGDGFRVLSGKSRVLLSDGTDVTKNFLAGAREAFKIVKLLKPDLAILKDRSPSCGVNEVYNNGKLVPGSGIFSALLIREKIKVYSEKEFKKHFIKNHCTIA